jgi:hypothetical protein
MVNCAVDGDPVPTASGSVPNASDTVSSSLSESSVVEIERDPELLPEAMLTVVLVGEKSPVSALPAVMVTGMLSARSAAGDTLTMKEAELPSSTVRDAGEKDTFSGLGVSSLMVSAAVLCEPVPTAGGSVPKLRLTFSSSLSESLMVEIVNVLLLSPEAKLSGVPDTE